MPVFVLNRHSDLSILDTYLDCDRCSFPYAAGQSMRSLIQIHAETNRPPLQPSPVLPHPSAFSPESPTNSGIGFSNFISGDHSISVRDTIFDLVALLFVVGLLFLSCLAFAFILHLQLRSRRVRHLQNFNSLWTVRSLLVFFVSLWAVNELLRLPLVRVNHFYPFLPSLTVEEQEDICKLYIVLSLGFLEPSILILIFYLLNVSIKETNPRRRWSLVSLLIFGFPIIVLQIVFVYFSPWETELPEFIHRSSVVSADKSGNKNVLCTYPFLSWLVFSGFAVVYSVGFLISCWRVMAFVINKGIGHRVYFLTMTVMVSLPVQILCLCLSEIWTPGDFGFGCVAFVMFISVVWCMAVAEVLLVLKPIKDALEAGDDFCRSNSAGGGGCDTENVAVTH